MREFSEEGRNTAKDRPDQEGGPEDADKVQHGLENLEGRVGAVAPWTTLRCILFVILQQKIGDFPSDLNNKKVVDLHI